MRTNIVIDDRLIAQAMKLSRSRTKREVVDRALRELVNRHRRPSLREMADQNLIDADYDVRSVRAGMARGSR